MQDWFVDHHIPRYARRHLVFLSAEQRILWITGLASFVPPLTDAGKVEGSGALQSSLLYKGAPVAIARGGARERGGRDGGD